MFWCNLPRYAQALEQILHKNAFTSLEVTQYCLKMAENGRMAGFWLKVAEHGLVKLTLSHFQPKFSDFQPLWLGKARILPENGWILAETGWNSAKKSGKFSHFGRKRLKNWLKWLQTAAFWLKMAEFGWRWLKVSHVRQNSAASGWKWLKFVENGWQKLDFGRKYLELANETQPFVIHFQAIFKHSGWKRLHLPENGRKWLSTVEFRLKMAAHWPRFSTIQPPKMAAFWLKMEELLPKFNHFQALSGQTIRTPTFRRFFARIDSQNKTYFWSAWPDSRESRLLSDSHSNARASMSVRKKKSKRESIRANRPTKLRQSSAIFSQSAWKWLKNCLAVRRRMSLVENCEWGCSWLQLVAEGLNHTAQKTAILNQIFFGPGGSICLEAKISHFQSLAWCLLNRVSKDSVSSATTYHQKKSSFIFECAECKNANICGDFWWGFLSDWWRIITN